MAHLSQWRVDIKEEPSLNVPAGVLTKVGLIPPKVCGKCVENISANHKPYNHYWYIIIVEYSIVSIE